MRTLLRPGRNSVLVKVEERGGTSFVLGGLGVDSQVYRDLAAALSSFADVEAGAQALRGEARPLLNRLRRRLLAVPSRA
jgi:hypothetical protein